VSASRAPAADDAELEARLSLVEDVLRRSPDPLDEPFRVDYRPTSGEDYVLAWKDFAVDAAASARHPSAVLYVHIPFCARVCSYCLLSAARTPGKAPFDAYLRALERQIDLMEAAVRGVRFSSLHIGGGTPSLLDAAQLDGLLGKLSVFSRTEGFQVGIEAHPATASIAKLEVLQRHGVDRISFGVESMTPEVLHAVNRADQTAERVTAAVNAARACKLSVNLDLLAGLPGETEASFAASVRQALSLRPDSMSVNRFLAENSALGEGHYGATEEETHRASCMLLEADRLIRETAPPRWPAEPLTVAGFGTQYVWDTTTKARPYFQQDMIGPSSTLALGHGGMGHVVGRFYSIGRGDFTDYVTALEGGAPPPMSVSQISERFEMAFYVAERACRDAVSARDFATVFRQDPRAMMGRELAFLVARGLLQMEGGRIRKPANPAFQVTHLLAFLALSNDALEDASARLGVVQPRAALRQYRAIGAELPPSLLWCRMAIRASRSRGSVRREA
jgi:coproporphyrinogen III oxidase-like Fe-S oxidoreductase